MGKTISVIIPTFNRIDSTHRAVNSVTSARPELVEIVVADDGGDVAYHYPGAANVHGIDITVVRSSHNAGPGLARQNAIAHSSGRAIAFLDSDDMYEDGWIDAALDEFMGAEVDQPGKTFMAGRVRQGSPATRLCLQMLLRSPARLRTLLCRFMVLIFNPFYTPSIVLSRELCRFSSSLRYCEDYYTNSFAIFAAKRIVISPHYACRLSRSPGALGGEASQRQKMLEGEMHVRRTLFRSDSVPPAFKLVVPLGVLYQFARESLKKLMSGFAQIHHLVLS
jgi:glycosyltransferase involved in cell wall biosynthesis